MLEVLQDIVQEVNRARNLDEVLSIIVNEVKEAMNVDLASVYLTDLDHKQHVLMLASGIDVDKLDSVRLDIGEGLVGVVAHRAEPINLADAQQHPRYRYFEDMGSEQFHAFLGVPIIHQRDVLGVLVVQRREQKLFSEESLAFLVTLAAQLAGAIAHAEAVGQGISIEKLTSSEADNRFFKGLAGAPGVGIGTVMVLRPMLDLMSVPDRPIENIDEEIFRYQDALARVVKDIDDMQMKLGDRLKDEDHILFDAYAMLVNSDTIVDEVIAGIKRGNWAEGSLRDVIRISLRKFKQMEDPYLRERGDDIREIGQRVLKQLMKTSDGIRQYHKQTILVGKNLGVTDLADAPLKNIVGIVSTTGSSSSHLAILARAMGIPTIMGVDDLQLSEIENQAMIVDGYQGRVYISPTSSVLDEFKRLAKEEMQMDKEMQRLRKLPSESTDGFRMPLYVNSGLLADIGPSKKSGAEGVGLYRTEFPFMVRDHFPGEEEQRGIYHQTLKAFSPRPVTLRTLDIGGDKALPYFPIEEENPFLGWRGIRITLDHREIFLTQVRAMLHAGQGLNNLNILLPMISNLSELDEAILLIDQVYNEILDSGEIVEWPKIGAMIEVPAAVYQAEEIAQRVDFLSIGTNDLTQYLLAVDRNNSRVSKLYDTLHPSVIRAIYQTVESSHKHGIPVGVCGEMAGDPAAVIALLGMGVDSLSMAVASLPRMKWVVRSFSQRDARVILTRILQMSSGKEIRKYLNAALDDAGLGGLIRAGKK